MDETKQRYRVADKERQLRLDSMRGQTWSLGDEIALGRVLLEESVQSGNPHLSSVLLTTLGKLTAQHLGNEIRMRRLISIEDLRVFAQRISESIVRHLAHVPNHEDIVEAIAADFSAGLCDLSKPVLRIGGTPNAQ